MQLKARIAAVFLLPIGGILINAARAEYLKPRDAGAQESRARGSLRSA